MNGFTNEQIIEIRKGSASFDAKLDVLAKFTASILKNGGKASQETKDAFFAVGYNEANMIDMVFIIADIIMSNFINNLTEIDIDFPAVPELTLETTW